jgi:membrane fusion protein (multidrug efflux system)
MVYSRREPHQIASTPTNPIVSRIILIASALLLVIVSLWYFVFYGKESTDNAYIKGNITLLSPKVTGYITQIHFADNQGVKNAAPLFSIDHRDYQARYDQAEAQLSSQKAKYQSAVSQKELQATLIQQAEAVVSGTQSTAQKNAKERARAQKLIAQNAVSQQFLDSAAADSDSANANVRKSKAALEASKQQVSVLDAALTELNAAIKNAESELALAKIDLDNTTITAPQSGSVGNRSAQIGQLVRPGTVLAYLIPDQQLWVEANFKETQITRMRPGQKVDVEIDSYPDKHFSGTVDSFSPAAGAEFSLLPPENATGNFTKIVRRIPVKILLDATEDLKFLKPGMSTEVVVHVK